MAFKIRTKKDLTYTIDYNGSTILCRPLTNSEYNKLRKECLKPTSKGYKTAEPEVDQDKFLIRKFDTIVLGWDFLDEDNQPVPCNEETKAQFLDFNVAAAMEIMVQIETLTVEEAAADQKN